MPDTIKTFGLLKKRADLSLEQFSRYWQDVHAEIAKKTMRLTHYVQNHRIEKEIPGMRQPDFDGVAESIARTLEAAMAFPNTRTYREGVYKDEPNFMEGHATSIIAREHIIIPGSIIDQVTAPVKMMSFFQRRPGMSLEECHDYWLNRHAPLVPRTPGIMRYIQNHVLPETYETMDPPFDGIAELWWPDMASYEIAIKSPELSQEQWKDTGKFANGKTARGMLCEEVKIVWIEG